MKPTSKENPLTNKTILLTGGTGSFGQTFTRIVPSKYHPKAIRIFPEESYSSGRHTFQPLKNPYS